MKKHPTIEFVHTGTHIPSSHIICYDQAGPHYKWSQILSTLSRNTDRSQFLMRELRRLLCDGNQVVLISDRLDLLDWLNDKLIVPPVRPFARIDGDTPMKERAEYLLKFRNEKLQLLLCSSVAENLALHELEFDYLFLATPTSASGFKKRYRLVLRQKTPPTIRDYVDDVEWIKSTVKQRIQTAYCKGWNIIVKNQPPGEKYMTNRHEETPAYCGRIGGFVTLEEGLCPECGWHAAEPPRCSECGSHQKPPQVRSDRKRTIVHTASRIPEKYVVVSGAGQSNFGPGEDPWETTAYDLALLEGGIENCNVVKYTSVIPPEAKEITMEEAKRQNLFQHGMVLECIMAQVNGNENEHICAGVGTFEVWDRQPVDIERHESTLIGGFAVEYEGNASPEKAKLLLNKAMNGLFERRYGRSVGPYMKNKKFHMKDLIVDKNYGTVLVALCFVSFLIPVLED